MTRTTSLHHVTAICGDPQRNVDFYCGVLGLRFAKKTVNFDDPKTYHTYYGDGLAAPGTAITFFPWPDDRRGKEGTGLVVGTAFAAQRSSLDYWADRLANSGVEVEQVHRFGDDILAFQDPDGMSIEIVGQEQVEEVHSWAKTPVAAPHHLRGFSGVTLAHVDTEPTERFLSECFGYRRIAEEGDRIRLESGGGWMAARIDLLRPADTTAGSFGVGTVHHIAFRAPNRDTLYVHADEVRGWGIEPSSIVDRKYFESLYFSEPGGVRCEIATDVPGFTRDEPEEFLGQSFKLPIFLESWRGRLERSLTPIHDPNA